LFLTLETCLGGWGRLDLLNPYRDALSHPVESKANSKHLQAIALGIAQMSTVELSSCGKSDTGQRTPDLVIRMRLEGYAEDVVLLGYASESNLIF